MTLNRANVVLARNLCLLILLIQISAAQAWSGPDLIGHWRYTSVALGSATDSNLLLHPDGTAEFWRVTAQGRSPREHGKWRVDGSQILLTNGAGRFHPAPFTLHRGQLVYPNIPDQRRYWEHLSP